MDLTLLSPVPCPGCGPPPLPPFSPDCRVHDLNRIGREIMRLQACGDLALAAEWEAELRRVFLPPMMTITN